MVMCRCCYKNALKQLHALAVYLEWSQDMSDFLMISCITVWPRNKPCMSCYLKSIMDFLNTPWFPMWKWTFWLSIYVKYMASSMYVMIQCASAPESSTHTHAKFCSRSQLVCAGHVDTFEFTSHAVWCFERVSSASYFVLYEWNFHAHTPRLHIAAWQSTTETVTSVENKCRRCWWIDVDERSTLFPFLSLQRGYMQ